MSGGAAGGAAAAAAAVAAAVEAPAERESAPRGYYRLSAVQLGRLVCACLVRSVGRSVDSAFR